MFKAVRICYLQWKWQRGVQIARRLVLHYPSGTHLTLGRNRNPSPHSLRQKQQQQKPCHSHKQQTESKQRAVRAERGEIEWRIEGELRVVEIRGLRFLGAQVDRRGNLDFPRHKVFFFLWCLRGYSLLFDGSCRYRKTIYGWILRYFCLSNFLPKRSKAQQWSNKPLIHKPNADPSDLARVYG